MIFQDPLSALTPVYTVGDQIAEAILVHQDDGVISRHAARARAVELLALVGIPNPRQRAAAFPHEFSGGMRQRVMIAMAIANEPDLIIADEPTTALDVTIQAQILDVLRDGQGGDRRGRRPDHPRPRRRRRIRGPRRGDVRGPHRRNRRRGRRVLPAADAVHAGPARLDSAARCRANTGPLTPIEGSPPSLDRSAAGCPVRAALPDAHREMCRGRAGAPADVSVGTGAHVGLPPQRRDRTAAI